MSIIGAGSDKCGLFRTTLKANVDPGIETANSLAHTLEYIR